MCPIFKNPLKLLSLQNSSLAKRKVLRPFLPSVFLWALSGALQLCLMSLSPSFLYALPSNGTVLAGPATVPQPTSIEYSLWINETRAEMEALLKMSIEELVNTQVEVTQRAIKSYSYLENNTVLLMIPFFILVTFFIISALLRKRKGFKVHTTPQVPPEVPHTGLIKLRNQER